MVRIFVVLVVVVVVEPLEFGFELEVRGVQLSCWDFLEEVERLEVHRRIWLKADELLAVEDEEKGPLGEVEGLREEVEDGGEIVIVPLVEVGMGMLLVFSNGNVSVWMAGREVL